MALQLRTLCQIKFENTNPIRGCGYKQIVVITVRWNGGGFIVQIIHSSGKWLSRF